MLRWPESYLEILLVWERLKTQKNRHCLFFLIHSLGDDIRSYLIGPQGPPGPPGPPGLGGDSLALSMDYDELTRRVISYMTSKVFFHNKLYNKHSDSIA